MREIALAERIGWAEVAAPGVVLLADGGFLAAFRYRGPDASAATGAELNLLASHVNDALLPFDEGWMLHVDALRRPATGYAPPGAFPDPATARLDAARRFAYESAGRHYETECVLSVTHRPPAEARSRLAALFVSGGERRGREAGRALAGFEERVRELQDRLPASLRLERLDSGALLTRLHTCLTGLHHPVRTPPPDTPLSDVLVEAELLGGFEPRIGALGWRDRAIVVVGVSGFPLEPGVGVLDALLSLPFAFRFSTRFIPMPGSRAAVLLARRRMVWRLAAFPLCGQRLHAEAMASEVEQAQSELASNAVRLGHYTPVIVVMEEGAETARAHAEEILKLLHDRGFAAEVETVNAPEAFLGSLPGHGGYNLRRAVVSSRNVADLLPLTAVWSGSGTCPSPLFPSGSPALLWARTDGSTPFRLNLHVSDVGHTLVLGPTGTGKSVLLGLLAAQWRRYPGARTFVFDVDRSALPLARASGARHYALAAGRTDRVRLQPLRHLDEQAERAWAAEWLEVLFELEGEPLSAARRERVDRALALVALDPPEHRTLTALLVQLQDDSLQTALRPYTLDGPLGYLLDAGESDLEGGDHEVFELRQLMDLSERVLVPTLLCLFRHVERCLDSARPTLVVIDEAWMALGHSLFARRISDWLLTWRKKNSAVVLATQSLSQLEASPLKSVILESCPTRILLPNPEALQPSGAALYRGIGLNETEVRTIATARPKRDYYYKSLLGSRLFELGLSDLELGILTGAGPHPHDGGAHVEALEGMAAG